MFYEITESEANEIKGKEFAPDSHFNPVQDAFGRWGVSEEEVAGIKHDEFSWLKDKPQFEFISASSNS